MRRKYFFIILTVFVLAIFSVYWFKLRRTPYSIAEVLTGIELKKELKISTFKDDWGPNGDGESLIIFSLSSEQQAGLQDICIQKGYQKLPIKEDLPDYLIYNYIAKSDSLGYYSITIDKNDERNYNISILSLRKRVFLVYNVIN